MKRVYATTIALAAALAPLSAAGPAVAAPATQSSQLVERVLQRAMSQRGVPFVYGGGDVSGPTNGARAAAVRTTGGITPAGEVPAAPGLSTTGLTTPDLAVPPTPDMPDLTTVGFDASGLIQYAFAGAGIKMPRRSGEQCSVGHKVTPAQALPGDLLCYGPGGSQSVALYLGNNQMIEGTNPAVAVSPARTSNMVPYLTRVIG